MSVLIIAGALGCGLVAGIFFAFSSFVMAALGRLSAAEGTAAMNAINVTVINPGFMLAFFGTAVVCIAAAAAAALRGAGDAWLVALAAVLYAAGCIGVTMARNVPLNNQLAAAAIGTPEAAALWTHYLGAWTFWNTVRTIAAAAAAVMLMAVLAWRSAS
ncbi:MAG: DUF1772 domain-containing protein [Pseudomonadota bacterium]